MATIAGDVTEIGYSAPTGSGVFYPKSDEDVTIDIGGFVNEDDDTMISGSGNRIGKKTRKAPMFEATISNENDAYERLVEIREANEDTTWTLSHISGKVYQVTGQPVGDIQPNLNDGTFTLKVLGNGKMEVI